MTSKTLRPYTIALIAAAWAVACGSKGTDTGGDKNAVTPGTICTRVAEIQCAGEAACCSNPGRDVAACVTAQKNVCSQTLGLDAAAMDPITGFDADKAKAALDKFESLATKCDTSISAFAIGSDGFRAIARGTVPSGGACDAATSTNKVAATAAALASCKDPETNACLPKTGGWKCAPRADAGGDCYTDANCKDGLGCDNPELNIEGGKCGPRKAAGADCTLGTECASFACKDSKCVDQTKDTIYCLSE